MRISKQFIQSYWYVLLATSWLMVFAPFHGPTRSMMRRMAQAAGWREVHTDAPHCRLGELTSQRAPVRVDESTRHQYNIMFYELFVLNQLVADRQPKQVFEFGTFNGRTTLNLAINTPDDTRITTIDLPASESPFDDHAIVGSCFRDTPYSNKITQLYGNTRTHDLSAYFGRMNFIFIDASHEYEDVSNDTELAMKLARPGDCMIVWHDYSKWPGVQRALDERLGADAKFKQLRQIGGTTMAVLDLTAEPTESQPPESRPPEMEGVA